MIKYKMTATSIEGPKAKATPKQDDKTESRYQAKTK